MEENSHKTLMDKVVNGVEEDIADIGEAYGIAYVTFGSENAKNPMVTNLRFREDVNGANVAPDGQPLVEKVFTGILGLLETTIESVPMTDEEEEDTRKWIAAKILNPPEEVPEGEEVDLSG